jgi:hypothetical protein
MDDTKRITDKTHQAFSADIKSNDNDYLRRQIKVLEDKLKRQRPAEKPYELSTNVKFLFKLNFYSWETLSLCFRMLQHKN